MKKINKFKVTHGTISTGFRVATYILEEDVLKLIDEQIKEAHKYNNEDVDLKELKKRIKR